MGKRRDGRGTGPWWNWEITVVLWWLVVACAVLMLLTMVLSAVVQ